MDTDVKKMVTNAMYLYFVQGLNVLLPLLILPYLIKTLSTESFGVYSFAFAFAQFLLLFVDFGFNLTATKKIAENSENSLLVKETFWNIITIKFVLSLLAFLVTIILILVSAKIRFYSEGIIWSFIMIIGAVFFPLWWFQGMNKMKEMSIINAVSKLLTYPLVFLLVKTADDYRWAIIIQSLSFLLAALFSILYLIKNQSWYFNNIRLVKHKEVYIQEIRSSFGIFLSNSSISLYTNSLTILLGLFSTNYNVGLFGAMDRMVRAVCFSILLPINQACFPIIVRMRKQNFTKAKQLFIRVLIGVFFLMFIAYLAFLMGKSIILEKFFEGYQGIEFALIVFMLMIFPIALGGIMGQLGVLGLGDEEEKKKFSRIYMWVGGLSLPLSVFCIKYFELYGAMGMMMGVESVIFILFALVIMNMKLKYK